MGRNESQILNSRVGSTSVFHCDGDNVIHTLPTVAVEGENNLGDGPWICHLLGRELLQTRCKMQHDRTMVGNDHTLAIRSTKHRVLLKATVLTGMDRRVKIRNREVNADGGVAHGLLSSGISTPT